jgi:hypothetical protein
MEISGPQRIERAFRTRAIARQQFRARQSVQQRGILREGALRGAFIQIDGILEAPALEALLREHALGLHGTHRL